MTALRPLGAWALYTAGDLARRVADAWPGGQRLIWEAGETLKDWSCAIQGDGPGPWAPEGQYRGADGHE